jgi:hypothetical protein
MEGNVGRCLKTITGKIEALTREPGYIYTLALILLRDLFHSVEEIADINPRDHLNFQEITFLVGLLVKHDPDFTYPTEDESSRRFELTYRLFEELHWKHHEPFLQELAGLAKDGRGTETREENYRRVFGAGTMMTEPIFYSGSGAYDFQYLEFAVGKYRSDAAWIQEHVGVDIGDMARIARELKLLHERKFNSLVSQPPGEFPDICQAGLSVFCFTENDLQQFGPAVKPFLGAFSLAPGALNSKLELPGQYNELQSRPIVRLPDGRYFLPIGFNLSEAIYESPFFWMNTDAAYVNAALLHRGQFAEAATAELVRSVFGANNVYSDVEIRERKGCALTDIDVLAIVGNKAVIVQVKSKRLTELAKLGDEKRLVDDFELAVQEAYDQGLLSRRALVDRKNSLFVNGNEIHLTEAIDDAYILCVTVDHYPAVTHQVDVYLKKSPGDPFPIALSIFDLDVLAFYLRDPFEFAYYLRQRVALSDYFKADSEMTLLGRHLKQKLFKSGDADKEMLDNSYAQLIDANFQVVRGSVPRTDAADNLRSQWKNEEFLKLVDQVKTAQEPRFTDALFFLYDLAGKGADDLIKLLKLTKRKAAADHQGHDARLLFSGIHTGITILCEFDSSLVLRKKLLALAEIAKYKSKADVWLGLGCVATRSRLVDAVVFAKYAWRDDPELEELAAHLRGKMMSPSGGKIGRNQRCLCESGKKFKHCCGK